jgi:hypothetical protein
MEVFYKPDDMEYCENCQFYPKKKTWNGLCSEKEPYFPNILTRCYSFKKQQPKEVEKPFWE